MPAWKTCEGKECMKERQRIANIKNIARMKLLRAKWKAERLINTNNLQKNKKK